MNSLKLYLNLLPAFGIILIIITAPLITSKYPGGSIIDSNTIGFEWTGNYWCNLYQETALNGQPNSARMRAIVSSSFLSIVLIGFFLVMNSINIKYKIERKIILIFGLLGVLFTPLGMTQYHDIGVILSGSLCAVAVLTILRILKKEKKYFLYILGYTWGILFAVNYLMFFNTVGIVFLPLLQKISFALFFAWIVIVNYSFVNEKLKNF